ncbi:hypothetical protein BGZ75_009295 [Mortierella antarctica]|nr:hypothetical protein BGZ75_009295 [Mortierella antarctica]
MTKISTLLWLAIAATVIVYGAPTGPISNLTSLSDPNFGPILLLEAIESNETLEDRLRERFESTIGDTSAFKSFVMMKIDPLWRIGKFHHCEPKIQPAKPIGTALYCDDQSPTSCQLSVTFINTQTVSTEDGYTSEFSISVEGGEPGIFEAKASFSHSQSHSVTHTYNGGKEFTYTFPVAAGRTCTPSIVFYYLHCQALQWTVENDAVSRPCSHFTGDYAMDFNDPHRWFVDATNEDWFQYIHEDEDHVGHLLSFHVGNKVPPTSCEDVVQIVDMRTLADQRNRTSSEAFLGFDNGQSISMVSCVY